MYKSRLLATAGLAITMPMMTWAFEFPVECSALSDAQAGTDCVLYYGDEDNRAVLFEYSEDRAWLYISQLLDDGTVVEKLDGVEINYAATNPMLIDLDGDYADEAALVPVHYHAGDITYELFRPSAAGPLLEPTGASLTAAMTPQHMIVRDGYIFSGRDLGDGFYEVIADAPANGDIYTGYWLKLNFDEMTCEATIAELGRDRGLQKTDIEAQCVEFEIWDFMTMADNSICDVWPPRSNGVTDCYLVVGSGPSEMQISFAYDADKVNVTQWVDGHPIAEDSYDSWGPATPPTLKDLDGQEPLEILLPVGSGNVNTEFQILSVNDVEYNASGTIQAPTARAIEVKDGLVFSFARENAYTYNQTASQLTSHGMKAVYSTNIDYSKDAGQRCTFYQAVDTLSPYGLSEDDILSRCEADAAEVN